MLKLSANRCPHHRFTVRPGGDEWFTIGRNTGVEVDRVCWPAADPPGGLTARDARVAVAYENDFTEVLALDLVNDVLDVSLLPGWHILLLRNIGQRQWVDAMACRTQMRHHIVSRPRSESRSCDQRKVRHGRIAAEQPDDHSGSTFKCLAASPGTSPRWGLIRAADAEATQRVEGIGAEKAPVVVAGLAELAEQIDRLAAAGPSMTKPGATAPVPAGKETKGDAAAGPLAGTRSWSSVR
jgi:hypothetical protein